MRSYWQPDQIARLVELARAGASIGAIATTLKRSKRSCASKITSLRDEGVAIPSKGEWVQRRNLGRAL